MLDLSRNYFAVFDIDEQFELDLSDLSERYRKLQQVVHPDRFANAGAQERRLSMQQATLVNEAYETLKAPVRRAQYLLNLKGIELQDEKETTQDMVFLMEQMALREQLEHAKEKEDPWVVVEAVTSNVSTSKKELMSTLASQLKSDNPEQLELAKEAIRKLQFLNKLLSQIETLEIELEEACL
jgi:molecular chaperone HscB